METQGNQAPQNHSRPETNAPGVPLKNIKTLEKEALEYLSQKTGAQAGTFLHEKLLPFIAKHGVTGDFDAVRDLLDKKVAIDNKSPLSLREDTNTVIPNTNSERDALLEEIRNPKNLYALSKEDAKKILEEIQYFTEYNKDEIDAALGKEKKSAEGFSLVGHIVRDANNEPLTITKIHSDRDGLKMWFKDEEGKEYPYTVEDAYEMQLVKEPTGLEEDTINPAEAGVWKIALKNGKPVTLTIDPKAIKQYIPETKEYTALDFGTDKKNILFSIQKGDVFTDASGEKWTVQGTFSRGTESGYTIVNGNEEKNIAFQDWDVEETSEGKKIIFDKNVGDNSKRVVFSKEKNSPEKEKHSAHIETEALWPFWTIEKYKIFLENEGYSKEQLDQMGTFAIEEKGSSLYAQNVLTKEGYSDEKIQNIRKEKGLSGLIEEAKKAKITDIPLEEMIEHETVTPQPEVLHKQYSLKELSNIQLDELLEKAKNEKRELENHLKENPSFPGSHSIAPGIELPTGAGDTEKFGSHMDPNMLLSENPKFFDGIPETEQGYPFKDLNPNHPDVEAYKKPKPTPEEIRKKAIEDAERLLKQIDDMLNL